MKTRTEFVDHWQHEVTGLLLAAFAQDRKSDGSERMPADFARDGHFMHAQMKRSRDLLGRMWDEMQQTPKAEPVAKATNGALSQRNGVKV